MKTSVHPNPFTNDLSLEVSVEEKESVIVSVLDHQQAIVRMFSWPLQKGRNKAVVHDAASLPAGEYAITLTNAQGRNLFFMKVTKS